MGADLGRARFPGTFEFVHVPRLSANRVFHRQLTGARTTLGPSLQPVGWKLVGSDLSNVSNCDFRFSFLLQ